MRVPDRRRAARREPQPGDAPVAARGSDPEAREGAAESVRRRRGAPWDGPSGGASEASCGGHRARRRSGSAAGPVTVKLFP